MFLAETELFTKIREEVYCEYELAITHNRPFLSAHEGYAVILEELEELKAEVFKKREQRDMAKMRTEAIQVAAMAMRFVADIIEKEVYSETTQG